MQNIATAQYRQAPAGRQQNQGGQGAQANSIRNNSARPITGQQQAAGIQVCIIRLRHYYYYYECERMKLIEPFDSLTSSGSPNSRIWSSITS